MSELDRIKQLFLEAQALPEAERDAYLEQRCHTDPQIRREVESLLGATPVDTVGPEATWGTGEPDVERFRIGAVLGEGGMGIVHRAYDTELEREVAIKQIRPELLASPSARARFVREAMAISRLNHPGLCQVFEVGESEGVPFFVMPLLSGQTLDARLREMTPPRSPARSPSPTTPASRDYVLATIALFEQIARAIHHAHEVGLVHRDLKPGNILITDSGQPVVLDFGLAQDLESGETNLTQPGHPVGTPVYMAPEQISGDPADRRTDVYALGITLFECLTLRRPFEAPTQAELFEEIRRRPAPDPRSFNRSVPKDLSTVISVALEKPATRRFRTAEALADDLERIRTQLPIHARRASVPVRVKRWVQRNVAAAATLTVLAGGLIALVVLSQSNANLAAEKSELAKRERVERRRYEELSQIILLRRARSTVATTTPPWPDREPSIRKWLNESGNPLAAALPGLRASLKEAEARALPQTPEDRRKDRESHPEFGELQRLEKAELVLKKAAAVRAGTEPAAKAKLPERVAKLPIPELLAYVRARAEPIGLRKIVGEEAEALAAADILLGHAQDAPFPIALPASHLLRCGACFALGLDEEARKSLASGAALMESRGLQSEMQGQVDLNKQQLAAPGRDMDRVQARLAEVRQRIDGHRTWRFENPKDEFLWQSVSSLVKDVSAFEEKHVRAAEERLNWATKVRDWTLRHPHARVTWDEAREAIRAANGETASALYVSTPPLDLAPQIGLVPLGMNPVTKLWEFYHLRSAVGPHGAATAAEIEIPVHAKDGSIPITPASGIVMVLIPGGVSLLGAQRTDPAASRYYEGAEKNDGEIAEHALEPFFLARHELTQAQWIRLSRSPNPSAYSPATVAQLDRNTLKHKVTLAHPLDAVSWEAAHDAMRENGLQLPSDAQWEYGCRAGTTTAWWTGATAKSLRAGAADSPAAANLADVSAVGVFGPSLASESDPDYDDGWALHNPVDGRRPNGFGLYNVHGNVAEWCQDRVEMRIHPVRRRPGDGLIMDVGPNRILRGGSFRSSPGHSRSSLRTFSLHDAKHPGVGLRAARRLVSGTE